MIKVIFNMLVKNIKTCNQMVWLTFFKVITELIFYQKKKTELIYIYIDKSIFYIEESSLFIMYHASGKKKKRLPIPFQKGKNKSLKLEPFEFWLVDNNLADSG